MTHLEQLPARIDELASQISQLRGEMRAEFSAVRGEMAEQRTTLRQEMAEQGAALRQEMAEQGATLRQEMTGHVAVLRGEIGQLATQMRVLHEDVIDRIARLQDVWNPPRPRRRRKP